MAEAQWNALPPQFQLDGSSKQFDQEPPFERDFLISTRLNHLHVLFLLRLLFLSTPAEPDASIFTIAGDILALVVEAMLIRDQVVNSGTSLKWKIAHYGLPAAGIVLLAMLKQRNMPMPDGTSRSKKLQDLSIFVAEIQRGSIVGKGDPLYVLLSKATQTIQKLLESFYSEIDRVPAAKGVIDEQNLDDWATMFSQDLWDFETGFWQSLAYHPSLGLTDSVDANL
ncbi:hypothetical protein DTO169C6_7254 [Paecilomyces variotii]|nr:hypothetical protein DTO169C6_7254 [Paecilomyces variotii]